MGGKVSEDVTVNFTDSPSGKWISPAVPAGRWVCWLAAPALSEAADGFGSCRAAFSEWQLPALISVDLGSKAIPSLKIGMIK